MSENKKNTSKLLKIALISSVAIHTLLLILKLSIVPHKSIQKIARESIKIKLKEVAPVKSKLDKIKRQIVTTKNENTAESPDKTRFLSEKSQKFNRQTVAKNIGKFKATGSGSKSVATKEVSKRNKKHSEIKNINKKYISNSKKPVKGKGAKVSLSDLALDSSKLKPANEKQQIAPQKNKRSNDGNGSEGIAQSNDFIDDVPLGDVTKLNTIEFKYYGFYHRIKQQLEQHWGNSLKQKANTLYKSGRRLPASDNLITSLTVIIDGMGNIKNIHVRGTSGIQELDQAAIESFNKAGPFPNPPQGMLSNGKVEIEWGFVVKG